MRSCSRFLHRYFAHAEESDAEIGTLADVAVGLMFAVIAPLGQLLTTLPVGPTRPGLTAGPSFELFYESDYLLPHRDAAWALIAARAGDPRSGLKRSRTSCTGMQESDRPTISDFS